MNWMNKCWLRTWYVLAESPKAEKRPRKTKRAIHKVQQRCLRPWCPVPETCSLTSFPFSPKQLPLSCTAEVRVLLDKEPHHVSFKPNCSPKDETLCSSPQVSFPLTGEMAGRLEWAFCSPGLASVGCPLSMTVVWFLFFVNRVLLEHSYAHSLPVIMAAFTLR